MSKEVEEMGAKKVERYRVLRMTEEELRRLEEDYARRIDGARMDMKIEFVDFTYPDFMEVVLMLMSDLCDELGLFRLGMEFIGSAYDLRMQYKGVEVEEEEDFVEESGVGAESFEEVTK